MVSEPYYNSLIAYRDELLMRYRDLRKDAEETRKLLDAAEAEVKKVKSERGEI